MKRFPRPLNPFKPVWDRKTADEVYEVLYTMWRAIAGAEGTPGIPPDIVVGGPGSEGTDHAHAPANHTHAISAAVPSTKVGFDGSPDEGESSSVLRSDARLVLEDGQNVGDTLVWNGEEWESGDPIPPNVVDAAQENSTDILAELKSITYLLKVGLNVPDSIEDIRKSFEDLDPTLAELKTVTHFLSAGLNTPTE